MLVEKVLRSSTITIKEAEALCGRCGRVAQILPNTQPWCSQIFGAFHGTLKALAEGHREAPHGRVACSRLKHACVWLWAILSTRGKAPVPLTAQVFAFSMPAPPPTRVRIEVDACPFGGGGHFVRRRQGGVVVGSAMVHTRPLARFTSHCGRPILADVLGIPCVDF